jgi:hypothetical protein
MNDIFDIFNLTLWLKPPRWNQTTAEEQIEDRSSEAPQGSRSLLTF